MIKSKNSERKITNHLQQDVVKVSGKTIFINPFLYWRRFDENTKQAILPLIVTIFIASFIGWSLGISKNSCNPYFEQNIDQLN